MSKYNNNPSHTVNTTHDNPNVITPANVIATINLSESPTSTHVNLNSCPDGITPTAINTISTHINLDTFGISINHTNPIINSQIKPSGRQPVGSTNKKNMKKTLKYEFLKKVVCQFFVLRENNLKLYSKSKSAFHQ